MSDGESEFSKLRLEMLCDGVFAIAILVSVAVAVGATREQLIGGLAALASGAALFVVRSGLRAKG